MKKQKLNSNLDIVKNKIKANSKDAHYAERLISELLSIKGQMGITPTIAHIEVDDVVSKLEGDTFTMYLTKKGEAVYHTLGGYTIIADHRMVGLNTTIANYILQQNGSLEGLSEEEKELLGTDMSATAHVLNIPLFAFSDVEFKYKLATEVVTWLNKKYDEAMSAPLQEETIEEDAEFKEAVLAAEELQE